MEEDDFEISPELFEEPEGFYPEPPKAHTDSYTRLKSNVKPGQPESFTIRLVGKSPLWGHLLWNASKVTCDYIDTNHETLVDNKTVLELGAGGAVPSIIASLTAKLVLITDYPELELINNIKYNIESLSKQKLIDESKIHVGQHIWGNSFLELTQETEGIEPGQKFQLIILADLIFNHTEHQKLLKTCNEALTDDGVILVFFTPHRPKLIHKDFEFFESAAKYGFVSKKVVEKKLTPMFVEDDETIDIRSTVYGFEITRA